MGHLTRTIARKMNLLGGKIDCLVGANRFSWRQAFLRPCECARQSSRKRTINPDSQVKKISMLSLKEKNPFHQNNANVLKGVGVLSVIPGRLFGEVGH